VARQLNERPSNNLEFGWQPISGNALTEVA